VGRSFWARLVSTAPEEDRGKFLVEVVIRMCANTVIVSYADFILVSMLHCAKRVNEDVFTRILALDEAFLKVYEACSPWLEKET
jgi:hypothetical protein